MIKISIDWHVRVSTNNKIFQTKKMERSDEISKLSISDKPTNASESFFDYNIYWTILDGLLFVVIVVGNILTILAVTMSNRLRRVTSNFFVVNLAISDLMVGLTLPYHLAFYLDERLGEYEFTCIMRFVLMGFACSASIYNIIAIAVDRYIAVVHPMKYPRYVTKTTVSTTIVVGWFQAVAISTVPIYWNRFDVATSCELQDILPRYYTVVIVGPLVGLIWLGMFLLYWKIWRAASTHAKRLKETGYDNSGLDDCKSLKVVLPILSSFSICWLPFLLIACIRVLNLHRLETPTLYKALFSVAMANSGMNPVIYAWKNTEFRKAFQNILHFARPDRNDFNSSLKDYLRKQTELTKNVTG